MFARPLLLALLALLPLWWWWRLRARHPGAVFSDVGPLVPLVRSRRWLAEGPPVALAGVAILVLTAPVLLVAFDELALVGVPANVAAAPLIGPITVWGLASGLVGGLLRAVAPPLADMLLVPTTLMLRALVLVARFSASMPMTLDRRAVLATIAVVVGVAVGIVLWLMGVPLIVIILLYLFVF